MVHYKDRSQLPADFTNLPLESALRVLLRSHSFDMQTLLSLEAKHGTLVEYIESILQSEAEDD